MHESSSDHIQDYLALHMAAAIVSEGAASDQIACSSHL